MNFNKKLATAVSGAVLLMAGQIALADSTTDIVDALVSKGVLTEEEGKLISKGAKAKADATPTVKEKDGAFILSSPNGKNSIQLTGRLHFDVKASDINTSDLLNGNAIIAREDTDSRSMGDHFNIRRARLGVKGRLGGIADYEIMGNLVGATNLDVAYLDINKYEPLGLTFGKFKVAPNLEIKTSSNNIDMIERSYVSQNAPEKRFGAALHGEVTGLTYFGSTFQNNDSALSMTDNKFSTAGRATVNFAEFMNNKDAVMHIGVNGYNSNYQIQPTVTGNTDSDDTVHRATVFGFTSAGQGLANVYRAQIANTAGNSGLYAYGTPSPSAVNVHNDNVGLEGILAYNNFKIQGEYSAAYFNADSSMPNSIRADVDTWYAEALWTLTGEKYADAYKKGAFGARKPKDEFNMDGGSGLGLWELGFRVDAFDVSNTSMATLYAGNSRFQGAVDTKNITSGSGYGDTCSAGAANSRSLDGAGCGGGAKTYTASLRWIMNPNMLIKANYSYTRFDNSFTPIDIGGTTPRNTGINFINDESLFLVRGQYMF